MSAISVSIKYRKYARHHECYFCIRNSRVLEMFYRHFCAKALILVNPIVQWNLDLRKILGVTKIFLKSRFFLISNSRKSLITYINNR